MFVFYVAHLIYLSLKVNLKKYGSYVIVTGATGGVGMEFIR